MSTSSTSAPFSIFELRVEEDAVGADIAGLRPVCSHLAQCARAWGREWRFLFRTRRSVSGFHGHAQKVPTYCTPRANSDEGFRSSRSRSPESDRLV